MVILPNADEAVIPVAKFTDYVLDPINSRGKWIAFRDALGYTKQNAHLLIDNIKQNLKSFPAERKGDSGYGETYAVLMKLTGANGKTAHVMTAWLDDAQTGEMRLTSAYIKKRRVIYLD
jgi:hypothetical protein